MNLVKAIEAGLGSINQARFQDLINHLLHVQGRTFIGAPGSVVGKEKTSKGSPDSFYVDGDKYVFVECTTKDRVGNAKSFHKKLTNDVEHCFNKAKTGIDPSEIAEIILACTETVTAEEDKLLRNLVASFNPQTQLTILDIQNLPLHIYDFPGLSEQYVGVTIVKGEIYTLADFLNKTKKGLQPSLTNEFVGRKEELELAVNSLEIIDLLLLTGPAGVGKSKLAVSVLEEVSKKGFMPLVIQSSAVPLWDDFVNLFQNGKDYAILFDDANKSVQNLIYLLDFIQKPRTNKLKLIITSRDYVKQDVTARLNNSVFKEIPLETLKDEEIKEIILKALPNLKHHLDIQRRIVELSKGNARVALMATYSVTPDAETNYLSSPALLYEKYFKKIAEETAAFTKPITLQAIAIVSFFGIVNKKDDGLAATLLDGFGIEWDELWTAIIELHNQEILEVHDGELVKVADQVLATYAFFKCFLDRGTAVIDYGKWVAGFMTSSKFDSRIKNTLIDSNNTFNYDVVKGLVAPHLKTVFEQMHTEEQVYKFYTMFWFYKGYDTLRFLREWIGKLSKEQPIGPLVFEFENNNHISSSAYFELLIQFWNHPNELLGPSVSLALDMVVAQNSRLPEFLKFLTEYFSYNLDDLQHGYQRQQLLFDILENENRSESHVAIANGTYLRLLELLIGIHFTYFGPSKGRTFTYYNFDLPNNAALLAIRKRMLTAFFDHIDFSTSQSNKVLHKIVYPGGKIDNEVRLSELPAYIKLIDEKLSNKQFPHCQFVKRLAKIITETGEKYPDEWNSFIESEVMELYRMLKPEWDRSEKKSMLEQDQEKRRAFEKFVADRNWQEVKSCIFDIEKFYAQLDKRDKWMVENGATEIFIALRLKGKIEVSEALELFLSGKLNLPINPRIIYFLLNDAVMTAHEILSMLDRFDFAGKTNWMATLYTALPKDQIDEILLMRMIDYFQDPLIVIPISRMMDFEKFQDVFAACQSKGIGNGLDGHNVISYLTGLILAKPVEKVYLGYHFCQECAGYFDENLALLKQAYIILKQNEQNFDYDGKELEAVLTLDNNFFVEYLQQKSVDMNYLSFRFEDTKVDYIWTVLNYKEIIKKSLEIIIEKSPVYSDMNHPAVTLFNFSSEDPELIAKAKLLISEYINENYNDLQRMMMVENIVLHKFRSDFVAYLRQLFLQQKDFEFLKSMFLSTSGSISSESFVPSLQRQIELCKEIMDMIKGLPDVLDYADHVDYLERKIDWLKADIRNEIKRDFYDLY
ncbi:MAG: hypothetical protein EON51_01945 [Acinetobacter sp.]|nr:MAG: hypothetical protein EON51_01945 [Acinetobacter sp.]